MSISKVFSTPYRQPAADRKQVLIAAAPFLRSAAHAQESDDDTL
ncbi:hypothetical protein [Chromobacterium haemolyticum]|nr:hypothetical protein [Chromobacterium haemolyticum]